MHDEVLDIGFVSPEAMGVVDELQLSTGLRINPVIAPLSFVEARLDALYHANLETKSIGTATEQFDTIGGEEHPEDENILNLDAALPSDANGRIVQMVNQILEQALRYRAATSTSSLSRTDASCGFGSTAQLTCCPHHRSPSLS